MAQGQDYSDLDFDNGIVSQEIQQISDNFIALLTAHSGSTPPSGVNQGAYWLDTSNTPYELKQLNSNDNWVSVQKLTSLGRDILNNLLTEQGTMDDLWTTEHNRDGTHKNPISGDIDQFKSVTWTTVDVTAVDTYVIEGDQTSTLLPDGDKGRMVRIQQPSQTVVAPVENATYAGGPDETTVTLNSRRTLDLDDTETIDSHEFGVVGPSESQGLPLISGDKIIDLTITTTNVNFTDQQLSTTDSPTFAGQTITDNNNLGIGTDNDYKFQYNTANTRLELANSTGDILRVDDGSVDVDFQGNITVGSNNITEVGNLQFSDSNGDGNNWFQEEDGSTGRFNIEYANSTKVSIIPDSRIELTDGVITLIGQSGDPSPFTGSSFVYAKNGTNGTEVFVEDESGNVTEISSHDSEGNYYVNHSVPSRGIRQEIDVEKAIKFLEKEFGKDFIREYDLEAE